MTAASSPPPTTVSGGGGPVAGGASPGPPGPTDPTDPTGGPTPGPTPGPGGAVAAAADEACPLCGAPLRPDQEWCLHCGAAARTRLATSSNWRGPVIAIAVVVVLSLGVLAASLVALAGTSGSSVTSTIKRTVTAPAQVTSPGTATTPAQTAPGAVAPSAPGAAAPVFLAPVTALTSSGATLNGTVNPHGVPTTYEFQSRTTASHNWGAVHAPVPLGAGTSAIAVNSRIGFLTPGTTYQYRLTASKAGRTISTAAATFTTPPANSRAPSG